MTIKPTRFGLSCAIVTPMRETGEINLAALTQHARWVLDHGCDSITLFGTTGEGAALTMAERERMIGAVLGARLVPEQQLYAGICATALGDALAQANQAYDTGAKGLLVLPPFYFKGVSDDGLFAWHKAFIEGLGGRARNIILYHIPSQSATPLSVDLVGRLKAAFPGVVTGVKDSSADWPTQDALLKAHGDLSILVGDETLLGRSVRDGGEGSICGVSNVAPGWLRPMVYEGREDQRINALVKAIVSMPIMSAVKALAAHIHGAGRDFCTMRAPLPQLTEEQHKRLIESYEALTTQKAA